MKKRTVIVWIIALVVLVAPAAGSIRYYWAPSTIDYVIWVPKENVVHVLHRGEDSPVPRFPGRLVAIELEEAQKVVKLFDLNGEVIVYMNYVTHSFTSPLFPGRVLVAYSTVPLAKYHEFDWERKLRYHGKGRLEIPQRPRYEKILPLPIGMGLMLMTLCLCIGFRIDAPSSQGASAKE